MRKVISTEMSSEYVDVSIAIYPSEGGSAVREEFYRFQTALVNPRVAIQIATLLTSDSTIPESKPCNCTPNESTESK